MITNTDTGWTEATIVINGKQLSFAEAMTLRVAVSSYRMWLRGDQVAHDLSDLAKHYDYHLQTIEEKMFGGETE